MIQRRTALLGACLLVASALGCGETVPDAGFAGLAGEIAGVVELATFTELADDTGVLASLEAGGPYTVFAPTNIAFVYVGRDAEPVLTGPDRRGVLTRVLRHHIVEGVHRPEDLVDGLTLTSLEGVPLRVQRSGPFATIEGVTIDLEEVQEAENGLVYPVADVIRTNLTTRERIELAPVFSQFADFAGRTGLLDALDAPGEQTAFVPIDDAFAAIAPTTELLALAQNTDVLGRVVRPHIVPGRVELADLEDGAELQTVGGQTLTVEREGAAVRLGGVRVLSRAYDTADGRIYLFGGVLFKGISLADRLRVYPGVNTFTGQTRDEIDIWNRLSNPDEALTVLAPVDGAYIRRIGDVSFALSRPENSALERRLRRVLVLEGRYGPDDLVDGQEVHALDGSTLLVRKGEGTISIGGQQATWSGAEVSNGFLYTLQSFVTPPVDPYDSAILSGYTSFAALTRIVGLEGRVRTEPLSIFLPTNLAIRRSQLVIREAGLENVFLFHMTPERLPFTPAPLTFSVLTGDERSYSQMIDPESKLPFGPLLIDAEFPIGDGFDSFDGRSRFIRVDTLSYPGVIDPG